MANRPSSHQADETSLKYLGFFSVAFGMASAYICAIYEAAKNQAGPLKPGVENVEDTFITVVGPVYKTIGMSSMGLLHLMDKKVDEKLKAFDQRVPSFVREKSSQAYDLVKQGPQMARTVAWEVKSYGYYETAKSLYLRCEPVAEQWSCNALEKLMQLPVVPRVLQAVAPSALYGAEKFNHYASSLRERYLPLAATYIPLIPVGKLERVAKVSSDEGIRSCNWHDSERGL